MPTFLPVRASVPPPPPLLPFIDRFWSWSSPVAGDLPLMLPGTSAECFFHLGAPLSINGVPAPPGYLVCNRHQTLHLAAHGPVRFVAVRFRAGQLRHFVVPSFSELQDRITATTDLWPAAPELLERLACTDGLARQAVLLGAFFLRHLDEKRLPVLDRLLDRLYYAPETRIEELATFAGWSRRNLDKRFLALYGVSPKYFARVVRLQRVARSLALAPRQRLLDVALDAGYFDQAHFSHDLRDLSGLSPGELRAFLIRPAHFYHATNGLAARYPRAGTGRPRT